MTEFETVKAELEYMKQIINSLQEEVRKLKKLRVQDQKQYRLLEIRKIPPTNQSFSRG